MCSNVTPIIIDKSYTAVPRGEKGHNKAFKKLFNISAFTKIDDITKTKQEKMCQLYKVLALLIIFWNIASIYLVKHSTVAILPVGEMTVFMLRNTDNFKPFHAPDMGWSKEVN